MTPIQIKPPRSSEGGSMRLAAPPVRPPTQLVLPGTFQPRKYHDWTGENPLRCVRCGLERLRRSNNAPWRYRIGPSLSRRRPDCTPTAPPPPQEMDS